MQDILSKLLKKSFPYCAPNYDKKFINIPVISCICDFCLKNPWIEGFYAKGSIYYGCMVHGSDIDHVRIKTSRPLYREEKKELVDELEEKLKEIGVSKLQRVREDNYVRVFFHWGELKGIPNACTTTHEIFPSLDVLTAKDPKDWQEKIIRTGSSYTNTQIPKKWFDKIKGRVDSLEI